MWSWCLHLICLPISFRVASLALGQSYDCFVVLCFVVVISCDLDAFIWSVYYILQGCFTGTGAIIWLPQCQWSNPKGHGWNWLKLNYNKVQAFSSKSLGIATSSIMRWISHNCSISHKIYTWFCCALFCCGYIMISLVASSMILWLLCWPPTESSMSMVS